MLKQYDKSKCWEMDFMCFWLFMLICDLLVPIIMIVGGRIMWKHCPKHINGIYGYRTTRSMKNLHTTIAENFGGK